ncbi:MAG: site-specific integrase [Mycetocola sp.]
MTAAKTPNKRDKGEGTIYKRKSDGMWCASLDLEPINGKRRRKVVLARTEAEAKLKLKEVKRKLAKDGDVITGNMTTAAWLNVWFETIALKKIRPKTAATWRGLIQNHMIPSIGKVQVAKLTPAHVRKMHAAIMDKGLSSTTALQAHRVLTTALKYALRDKKVTENVATLTDAPKKAKSELAVLTAMDGVKVIQSVADDRLGSRWAAALFTGARQGELIGLEIDRIVTLYDEDLGREITCLDLSWQLQRLSWEHGCGKPTGTEVVKGKDGKPDRIRNTFTCGRVRGADCIKRKLTAPADWEHRHLRGGLWLSRPKSSAGWRIIPLVEPLKGIIERRMQIAQAEGNKYGLLWTDEHGQPLDPKYDNYAWHDILDAAGVKQARLHDARHTTASLLLAAKVPEMIITKILGHSSYATSKGYMNVDIMQLDSGLSRMSALMPLGE